MPLDEANSGARTLTWNAAPLFWPISKIHIRWSTGRASGHNPPFSGNARQRRKQDRAWRCWVASIQAELGKVREELAAVRKELAEHSHARLPPWE